MSSNPRRLAIHRLAANAWGPGQPKEPMTVVWVGNLYVSWVIGIATGFIVGLAIGVFAVGS